MRRGQGGPRGENMPGMGIISREYTVWCGYCELWLQFSEFEKISSVAKAIRKDGWKIINKNGLALTVERK